MAKYVETQTSKIISSYGGVGSIIETINGALLIEPFDRWRYFHNNEHLKPENQIVDNRLLNRLKFEKGFPKLRALFRVPINTENYKNKSIPQFPHNVIDAKFFPEWFFCPNCERLHKISDWWLKWKNVSQLLKIPNETFRRRFYEKPKCYHCLQVTNGKSYIVLEQVRFIMTAPDGAISDIPWDRWNTADKNANDEYTISKKIILDFEKLCCEDQILYYIRSAKFSDLAGIRIECRNCGKKQTLSGLFSLRLSVSSVINEDLKTCKKPVIRTSNSVYYPIIINSLYLPTEIALRKDIAEEIDKWLKLGKSHDFIVEVISMRGYSKESILQYLQEEKSNEFESELEYRLKEYNFLTNPNRPKYPSSDGETDNLIFEKQDLFTLENYGIDDLVKIKRLKITSVQTAYTRQEPLDKDQFLKGNFESVKPKYTSIAGKNTEYLPAVENFGEGIFINFNNQKIETWINVVLADPKARNRIELLHKNTMVNYLIQNNRFSNISFLTKFVMIHTLSHILIKEFEFSVGYPATSLNERLYIDNQYMSGLLIYTIAGSEGSYGGIVAQANEKSLLKILNSALTRANDCASDPICYNAIDGQGIGGLNLAACYSCAILPDISCEEFNSFLDRALLIDKRFGFFSELNFV